MSKDLIEIITKDSTFTFTFEEIQEVEEWLSKQSIPLRLDLHGVADILNYEDVLPAETCVISFVGRYSNTRDYARHDIVYRIMSGQIVFGILVFERGRRNRKNQNTFHNVGSKAWVNSHIERVKNVRNVFVDDSYDHYNSVKSKRIRWLSSYIFKSKDREDLLEMLNNIYK